MARSFLVLGWILSIVYSPDVDCPFNGQTFTGFLPRDAYAYSGLSRGKMSVCPSVCHAGIESKRLYIAPLL